jgi:hypothetical protein
MKINLKIDNKGTLIKTLIAYNFYDLMKQYYKEFPDGKLSKKDFNFITNNIKIRLSKKLKEDSK